MIGELEQIDGWWAPRGIGEHGLVLRRGEDAKAALPHVAHRHICVQAGGFIGVWPRFLARHFQAVYTFEPVWLNFLCVVLNNETLPNVYPMRVALGHRGGLTGTNVADIRNTSRTQMRGEGWTPMVTLDSLDLPALDLLCLDVESYELPVIKGGWNTIMRCKPTIMLEVEGPRPLDGRTDNYADVAAALPGYRMVARVARDVVLRWVGGKETPEVLGKPRPEPTQPAFRK